jgi:hypothetical protein
MIQAFSRVWFGAVLATVLLGWVFAGPVSAGPKDTPRQTTEPARKRELHPNAVLFARAVFIAAGGLCLWIATGIARNGFGFGAGVRRVTGPPAWTVASVIAVLGLVIAVGGTVYTRKILGGF